MERLRLGDDSGTFAALTFAVSPSQMLEFLAAYRFSRASLLDRQVSFLRKDLGDPAIDRWLAIWPLLEKPSNGDWELRSDARPDVIVRNRFESGRFNIYTGPDHVSVARIVNGMLEGGSATSDTLGLRQARTAAALFYAVREPDDTAGPISIGFALYPPNNDLREKTRWGVRVASKPDDPIVETPSAR